MRAKVNRKALRKLCACLLVSLCVTLLCPAQDKKKGEVRVKPDFSGTWKLHKEEGNERPSVFGRVPQDEPESLPDVTLIIMHREPEIKITSQFKTGDEVKTQEAIYHTDKREELLPVMWDGDQVDSKSKTEWKGEKLVSRHYINRSLRGYPSGAEITRELKLSSDGKTLTQTIRILSQNLTPEKDDPLVKALKDHPVEFKRIFIRIEK